MDEMNLSEEIRQYIDKKIQTTLDSMFNPSRRIYVIPGGKMPEQKTPKANALDVFLRAIVSADEKDSDNKILRKTLFDFKDCPTYTLTPGKSVIVGAGFIVDLEFPEFYIIPPRSGLLVMDGINITNALCPVDSDYRGEAGIEVCNHGKKDFILEKHMRIAQILFLRSLSPIFEEVDDYEKLSKTLRGERGFGSTGRK